MVATLLLFGGGGYPSFGHFLANLGISGENGVPDWSPGSRQSGTPPFVGHLRGPPEGVFCAPCVSGAQIHPRGGGDPRMVVCRFLCWLASFGRPAWHTVFTKCPQNCQKVPIMGSLPLTTFSGTCRQSRPPCRRISQKLRSPPADGPVGGFPHFLG